MTTDIRPIVVEETYKGPGPPVEGHWGRAGQ